MLAVCLALIDDEEDKKAFEKMYFSYKAKLFSIAYKILNDDHLAEDALSETFISAAKCFKKIHNLEVRELTAYLVITTRNNAIDIYNYRRKTAAVSLDEFTFEKMDLQESEFDENDNKLLRRAISKLTEKQRTVITYKYFYGLTIKEIAETMSVTTRAVDKLLFNAKNNIKATLKAGENDGF